VRRLLADLARAAARGVARTFEWTFDRTYGLLLALVRAFSLARSSAFARRVQRTSLSFARISAIALAAAALVLAALWASFVRVPHGMIGVRQQNVFGRGIEVGDHEPGLVFSVRGLETWHFVSARSELVAFAWESEAPDRPMLELRTRDGNLARLGAAVVWRVRRGEAHELVREGSRSALRERVTSTAESVLLDGFSRLSSAEIVDGDARAGVSRAALLELDRRLAPLHAEVESVLVTQVMFGPEYEKKLQQKQLVIQTRLLQQAATGVEAEQEKVGLFEQETERLVQTIVADSNREIEERFAAGRAKIAAIRAEISFYDKTRRAEAQAKFDTELLAGETALARVELLKTELANKSWSTAGGRLLLARKAAENLNIRQVTLNSNDPRAPSVLDLDDLVRRLVGAAAEAPRAP
jgi:hypothetical protein